jgi:hypothetical protein
VSFGRLRGGVEVVVVSEGGDGRGWRRGEEDGEGG